MQQTSPPWRVFDAPTTSAPGGGSDAPASDQRPNQWPLPGLPPLAFATIAIAVAVGALAVAIAIGAPRGSVAGPAGPDASLLADEGAVVVVEVAGAVARPGVYRLPAGSRVGDGISAAGGFSPRVAVERADQLLNLAAVLKDGERIAVPSRDDPAAPGDGGPPADGGGGSVGGGLVDLNTATQIELESLPGIGPVTAGKIMASRSEAAFRSVQELRERGLVGEATFEKIRDLVSAG